MFIDLNVPVPTVTFQGTAQPKKAKGKQTQHQQQLPAISFTPAQLNAIEARIDLLIHCQSCPIKFR